MRLNVKIPYFITTIINSFYFCQKLFAIFLPRGCCHCCQEVVAGTVIAMAITGYNRRWQQLANPAIDKPFEATVVGPTIWNNLPSDLCVLLAGDSAYTFYKNLKTVLYRRSWAGSASE